MNFLPLTILALIGFFNIDGNDDVLKREYYANGNIKIEYILKNSKIVDANYYYENGQLREQGQFKGQSMHGTWESYNNNGVKIAEVKYNDGKALKKTFWNNDGTIAAIITENGNDQLVTNTEK